MVGEGGRERDGEGEGEREGGRKKVRGGWREREREEEGEGEPKVNHWQPGGNLRKSNLDQNLGVGLIFTCH